MRPAPAAKLKQLGADVATLGENAGYRGTLDALAKAENAAAISRMARLSKTSGKATRGALFVLGDAALTLASIGVAIFSWTAGAIGLMTAAVMTRATLGHTGQPLQVERATQAIYALLLAAALVRIVAAFMASVELLEFAGLCWTAAFILFVLLYGPLLAMRSPGWNEARR